MLCSGKEPPSPERVVSAPSKKERISFRDNPVKMSGGWGGGKKRDRVHKWNTNSTQPNGKSLFFIYFCQRTIFKTFKCVI